MLLCVRAFSIIIKTSRLIMTAADTNYLLVIVTTFFTLTIDFTCDFFLALTSKLVQRFWSFNFLYWTIPSCFYSFLSLSGTNIISNKCFSWYLEGLKLFLLVTSIWFFLIFSCRFLHHNYLLNWHFNCSNLPPVTNCSELLLFW